MRRGTETERLLLTVPEAAEALGISRSHAYQLLASGQLPCIRLGRAARIPKAWLEKWVAEQCERWEAARRGAL